jgi:hypothetical protein
VPQPVGRVYHEEAAYILTAEPGGVTPSLVTLSTTEMTEGTSGTERFVPVCPL